MAATLYARPALDPNALRPDGRWAAIIRAVDTVGRRPTEIFHAIKRPGQSRERERAKIWTGIGRLLALAYVEYRGGYVHATRAGLRALDDAEQLQAASEWRPVKPDYRPGDEVTL